MPNSSSASLSLTFSTACQHALAEVLRLVAVAEFPRLVHAGAGPAGHGRGADRTVVQLHVDFDGRIAAAIENLPAVNVYNHAHIGRKPFLASRG